MTHITKTIALTTSLLGLAIFLDCSGHTDNPPPPTPAFTLQPLSTAVHSADPASFAVAASGNPIPTFIWERSDDGGNTWGAIPGATSATYTFRPLIVDNGSLFRAKATNNLGTSTSNTATLTVSVSVYAAGWGINQAANVVPGYWKNGIWVGLPQLDATLTAEVNTLIVSGPDVYAAGYCTHNTVAGFIVDAAGWWFNGAWTSLPPLTINGPSKVNSLVLSGSNLYAGGWCVDGTGYTAAGYWKNGTWVGFTPLNGSISSEVDSFVVSGGDVYAAGDCFNRATTAGYWKNGNWVSLPSLDTSNNSAVYSITVNGANVYAAGCSCNSLGVGIPGYWKNGLWIGLPSLSVSQGSAVKSLLISGSDVYAGGFSTNSSGVSMPGYWKNGTWVGLTALSSTYGSTVNTLVIDGNDVYAGGHSRESLGDVAGYWKNGAWVGLPPLYVTYGANVTSLVVQ